MSKSSKEHTVLMKSRRRCCFCFGLSDDLTIKKGQVAHLDQNPINDSFSNLAWMCLAHHDDYDSRTSQSRGLTEREAKDYRDKLYRYFDDKMAQNDDFNGRLAYKPASDMDEKGRAHQKRVAYGLMRSPKSEDRRSGLLMLIEAYFHREPKNQVRDFGTYAAHFLHANKDKEEFDSNVVEDLIKEYGMPKCPRIKRGYSEWGSYGDPSYSD